MYQSLANVTTADDFTDAATLRLPGTVRIVLQVANAAVFYQLDESEEGKGLWTGERFLSPSIGSLDRRCSGIRFRSALLGKPAQVSCELADEDELTGASDSLSAFTSTVGAGGGVTPGAAAVQVSKDGVVIGSEPELDFLTGAGLALTVTDDAVNERVRVTHKLRTGAFRAVASGNTSAGSGVQTKMGALTSESFDAEGWYDAPNARYTPQLAGAYLIAGAVIASEVLAASKLIEAHVWKNGADVDFRALNRTVVVDNLSGHVVQVVDLVNLNGATDYVEIAVLHDFGSAKAFSGRIAGFYLGPV